ncbi:MAG: aminotransferase class V-fold PLP-dependent enzyme [Xanthomonadales bacterium PRO6]|nr:aminotransferase class V-fold PLP-dependent enzyme [Xanthomonadales bacterium PRO6]
MQAWFARFRAHTIGVDVPFESPYGRRRMLYADWIASGRMYAPIEDLMRHRIAPFVGNTHTETSEAGSTMTRAYHHALGVIKRHVNAGREDAVVSYGSGMTAVVNKFQRILGLRVHENYLDRVRPPEHERPVVFITHMEHHSNQTSWLETICEVRVIPADADGLVDLAGLDALLSEYRERPVKIASVTSCSNVTGLFTPYHEIAERMHRAGGLCFVDFAASAPYIDIDMHPAGRPDACLDAIFFSPHKFLGGPGTSGVLIFNKRLYRNRIPDNPGGGTVDWTNPWGQHKYVDDVESREDGGTPGFLQAIRTAFCIQLKEAMGTRNILAREREQLDLIWPLLTAIPGLHVLAGHQRERIGCISFYIDDLHYNLAVRLLNDRYGIQVRGGCSCAGTYGHYLLQVSREHSKSITDQISCGILSEKPGWVRLSLHPTMTDAEILFIADALGELAAKHGEWARDYRYCPRSNEYTHVGHCGRDDTGARVAAWFGKLV